MNLKEAFRYQTFLDYMMQRVSAYLSSKSNVVKFTRVHKKNMASPDIEDVTESQEPIGEYTASDVVSFALEVINQKELLSAAIVNAKAEESRHVDVLLEGNKLRRGLCTALDTLATYKLVSRTTQQYGYRLNVAGDQTRFFYDCDETEEPAFNTEWLKELRKTLHQKSDEVSTAIEQRFVNTEVQYEPLFDPNDSFEEAMEEYFKSQG